MNATALLDLARKVEVAPLGTLYRLTSNYRCPPSPHLLALTRGREANVYGEADPGLRIFPDGSEEIYAPFAWDGSSPRLAIKLFGRVLFSLGTPNGPRVAGHAWRAAARGSMKHDRNCRSAALIAATLGCSVRAVYAAADLDLRDDISADWSPRWGDRFYRAVTFFGDAYRSVG
jgi:hypothetical protein